jgi:hypothetical protein
MMELLKKSTKFIGKTLLGTILLTTIYSAGLIGLDEYCSINSKRIKNEGELFLKIEEFRDERKIPKDVTISTSIYPRLRNKIQMVAPNYYLIYISERNADEYAVRHELEHVVNGDLIQLEKINNKYIGGIVNWFWQEPRAVFNSTFR